jgi:hypothetical protein
MSAPTRETTVEGEKKGSERRCREFGGGEGEPKIRLGKGGDGATKGSGHGCGLRGWDIHRDETRLVEVDSQASCRTKSSST